MKIRGRESLPEVRDAGPVAVRRDLNDPAASAMAAAAGYSSKAGQYVAQGARDLATGIEKMARDRAEAGALTAYNDYVSRSSRLLYDPNTGLMHAKGAGAEGLSGRVYQAHKALKDEIMSALPAGQRRLFMERTASYDRGVGSACMKLEGEQMSLYKQEEAERTLKTIYTAAALNPDGFSMEAQEDAFREITIARYGDQGPEANLKNSALVRSEFFIGMIQQAAQNDPTRAEALVKEYGGYIEPADAQKLKGAVEKAALPVKAQAEAQRLLEKYGADGLASALADVRGAHEGKEEDVYLGYVNSLFADAKQEREAELDAAKVEVLKLLYGGGSHGRVSGLISSYSEKFKKYGARGEAWALSLKVDNDRVHGSGIFAPKPKEAFVRAPLTRAEAVRQLVHFNPDFAALPKDEQERLIRRRLGVSEEQHDAYFAQLGDAKLRGMSNEDVKRAAAMGYISYEEADKIIEYEKKISPGNKDYLKTKEKNIEIFLKNHGGGVFGGAQNPDRNMAVFYFREECRKIDPAAPDFYKQADEAGRRAMLRAIEEKHASGVPLIDGYIWKSDTELGKLKKAVEGVESMGAARDVPPRPWETPSGRAGGEAAVQEEAEELDEVLELNADDAAATKRSGGPSR
ncbi:hypothetical protein [Synergistes jonesii]|uniref:Uncharacterized protein n=3 Tax=Synergistes jonesii TaxID=2754 RepID=A0A073IQ62_9BACT|nr:hypothetical protein [Synergistes jonesii]KEJ91606.1 hypothetical protein EH55_08410 [Synergistes jonesii]OFB60839.1 hypothetical protein JS73_10495 [Synergistes jonesii]OFB61752.1 hypothetical protein JS79_10645 [Synergistes jonesii]OFB63234.1 hypothetical protein JS72_07145 [Synergistes jonesii]OFB66845.1 hypothetical protein JS78_10520 [Synergistes jonesii]